TMKLFLNENPIRVSYRAISTEIKVGAHPSLLQIIRGIEAGRRVSLERFRRMLGMLDHFGIISIAARKRRTVAVSHRRPCGITRLSGRSFCSPRDRSTPDQVFVTPLRASI